MNKKIWKFILLIFSIIFLFLKLWVPFGKRPSKKDRLNYASRAKNFKHNKFYNENKYRRIYIKAKKNNYLSIKDNIPTDKIITKTPKILKNPDDEILTITWLGHSSIFFQMHGMNILIDPVLSNHASPFPFPSMRRFSALPIKINDFDKIDIVVITHDHYDHLDYKTIKKIDKKVTRYIVPLGVEKHLERWKIKKEKIISLAWWEEIRINGLLVACTPARHSSFRNFINDSYKTLWSSWVFIDEYHKIFESGDTGFDSHFEKISKKYGDFDLAVLEAGQYNEKWRATHMTPEESVKAGMILKAKMIMPIHWGTFSLADHPWDDPVERFTNKADKENIKWIVPKIGETIAYGHDLYQSKWWTNLK